MSGCVRSDAESCGGELGAQSIGGVAGLLELRAETRMVTEGEEVGGVLPLHLGTVAK